MNCDVQGCEKGAIFCWGHRLCLTHGAAANAATGAQGLNFARWPEHIAAVDAWLEKLNSRATAGEPLGLQTMEGK